MNKYESPVVDVVGSASALIQNFMGPYYDGDAYQLSLGAISSSIEAE
jgi:hypothetical protein